MTSFYVSPDEAHRYPSISFSSEGIPNPVAGHTALKTAVSNARDYIALEKIVYKVQLRGKEHTIFVEGFSGSVTPTEIRNKLTDLAKLRVNPFSLLNMSKNQLKWHVDRIELCIALGKLPLAPSNSEGDSKTAGSSDPTIAKKAD